MPAREARRYIAAAAFCASVAACATTTVQFSGAAPAASLCQARGESLKALVLWDTHWRPDQKEPARREAAAEQGIRQFLAQSGCYAHAGLRRGADPGNAADVDRVVMLTVRELGPVLKLLSSFALVDGGTEVVLDIATFQPAQPGPRAQFTVHWQNGGHLVVKGVASLAEDMEAALVAALRPAS